MFLSNLQITGTTTVNEIASLDYRTADVFRKYGIDFCCGGRIPLEAACKAMGLDEAEVMRELEKATRDLRISARLPFEEWNLDFLADYIAQVHHNYARTALPEVSEYVSIFLLGHQKKFPELKVLEPIFKRLTKELLPHFKQEEEIIFPYIRQITNAYRRRESYASLLVRTLRKPVKDLMEHEHQVITGLIDQVRSATNNYQLPEKACVTHRVTFAKLREFDNDMMQHLYLENDILFPRAIEMEKELLQSGT